MNNICFHISLAITFLNLFYNFIDFQLAWTNFMVPNNGIFIESIHAKLIWALVGSNIHYIFFDIDSRKIFVWYFDWYWSSSWYMKLFYTCYWANLVSYKVLSLLPWYTPYHLTFKIPWICMLLPLFECYLWLPWHLFHCLL